MVVAGSAKYKVADVPEHFSDTAQEKSEANDVQIIATQKKEKKKKRKYYVSSSSESSSSDTELSEPVNKRRKKAKKRKSENNDQIQKQKNQKKKWSNDEISRLIDLYEARPCLWDVFTSEHHNRETTSKAKAEIEVGYIFHICFWEKTILTPATTVLILLLILDLFCYFVRISLVGRGRR